jgi:hypothetical protein
VDRLRKPLLFVALVVTAIVVLLCLGSGLLAKTAPFSERVSGALGDPTISKALAEHDIDRGDAQDQLNSMSADTDPPGFGVKYLALPAGLLLVVMIQISLPMLVGDRVTGSTQGVISIVTGIVGIILGIVMAILAFVALILRVSLFLAAPFGTMAYLAIYGFFPTGRAAAILGTVMVALLAVGVLLLLAQQRFLQNRSLVLLFATCLALAFVTMLLHGIVPGILSSITDALAGLIIAIVGIIWALVMLIGGIVAALRAVQLVAQVASPDRQRT